MKERLTDTSPPIMARAVQGNLFAFFRALQQAPVAAHSERAGLARWHTRIPYAWFNGVLVTQPPPVDAAATVQETISYFARREVSIFTWWPAADLPPGAWDGPLRAAGFGYDDHTPGMALDLRTLAPSGPTDSRLAITTVSDPSAFAPWCRTLVASFGMPPAWLPALTDLLTGLGLSLPLQHFLAYLDGEPAATATLFLAAGVAGIYNVATLPAARGQGVGAAVTRAGLEAAMALGYRVAVLQSSDMGFSVYRRLGFTEVCRMGHYYWRAGDG